MIARKATGGQVGRHGDGQGRAKQIVIAGPVSQPHPAHPGPRHSAILGFLRLPFGLSVHLPCAFLLSSFPLPLYTQTRSTQSLIKR